MLDSESIDTTCSMGIMHVETHFNCQISPTWRFPATEISRYRSQSRHVVSPSAKELPIGAAQDFKKFAPC